MRFLDPVLDYVDPGRDGFLTRWRKLLARLAVVGAVTGCAALVVAARSPFGRYMTGVLLMSAGRPATAEGFFRDVIEAEPDGRYAPYSMLASVLVDQGRGEEALDVLNEAVRVFPRDYRAQVARCARGLRLDRGAEVRESCEIAADMRPREVGTQILLARAVGATDGPAAAVQLLETLVARCAFEELDARDCARAERELLDFP